MGPISRTNNVELACLGRTINQDDADRPAVLDSHDTKDMQKKDTVSRRPSPHNLRSNPDEWVRDDNRTAGCATTSLFQLYMLLGCMRVSIILSSVKYYVAAFGFDQEAAQRLGGLVVALPGMTTILGQIVFAYCTIRWKGFRAAFLTAIGGAIVANLMYSLAWVVGAEGRGTLGITMLFIANGLVGFFSPWNIVYSYYSITTGKKQMGRAMLYNTMAICTGLALGPFAAVFFSVRGAYIHIYIYTTVIRERRGWGGGGVIIIIIVLW